MFAEEARFARLLEIVDDIEQFPSCGPSDDPDLQTNVVYGLKHLATRIVGAARRIKNQAIQDALDGINTEIEDIYGAYNLRSSLQILIDEIHYIEEHPQDCQWNMADDVIVDKSVINDLRAINNCKHDLSKVAQLCEELNSSYANSHFISCLLLIKAILNHIPPVFGHTTFAQVVSNSTRSVKEILSPLEEVARDVSDHHSHSLVRHKENLPTRAQIEPFKPNIEVLIHELIVKASEDG